jgi:hypothetical protein
MPSGKAATPGKPFILSDKRPQPAVTGLGDIESKKFTATANKAQKERENKKKIPIEPFPKLGWFGERLYFLPSAPLRSISLLFL